MALINWNDRLSVKVAVIDLQHQRLISMINELADAMSQGKGKGIVGGIIERLIYYTGTHFKTEERYFDRFAYPDAEAHKKEHAAFVEKVLDYKQRFSTQEGMLSVDVINFLKDWLYHHISKTDRGYSRFFNDHGLR
jgi:hemerythrin